MILAQLCNYLGSVRGLQLINMSSRGATFGLHNSLQKRYSSLYLRGIVLQVGFTELPKQLKCVNQNPQPNFGAQMLLFLQSFAKHIRMLLNDIKDQLFGPVLVCELFLKPSPVSSYRQKVIHELNCLLKNIAQKYRYYFSWFTNSFELSDFCDDSFLVGDWVWVYINFQNS